MTSQLSFFLFLGSSGPCSVRLGWCSLDNPVAGCLLGALSQVCRQLPARHVSPIFWLGSRLCLATRACCPRHAALWLRVHLRTFAPAAEAAPAGCDSAACPGGRARLSLTQWGPGMSSSTLEILTIPIGDSGHSRALIGFSKSTLIKLG